MNRCRKCKKPMVQVWSSYAPRDGRLIQTEVQYECKQGCGTRLTISDPQERTRAVHEQLPVRQGASHES